MHRISAIIIVVATSLVFMVGVSAQDELLTNPGFEELDAKGAPVGWTQYGGGAPESILRADKEAHSGGNAMRMIDTGPEERNGRYAIGVSQSVPVEPGKLYIAGVWAKCLARNNAAAVILQLNFEPSRRIVSRYIAGPVEGDWRRYTVAGVAPDNSESARLYIYTMHYWTSETLIDDATFTCQEGSGVGLETALWTYGTEPFTAARPLHKQTSVVRGGAPVSAIVAPDDADYRALASKLQSGIAEKTGATVPIIEDPAEALKSGQTVVAIGNLNNNFVIERLYFNQYTRADSLWPGAGNFALRTVHQPVNFAEETNVLTVEASDLEGARKGVEELLTRLPEGKDSGFDEPLLFVSNSPSLSEAAEKQIVDRAVGKDMWLHFAQACERYRDTGQIAEARHARRIMGMIQERYVEDPHYHVTWPEETNSNLIGAMWDVIEEAPVWTDAERVDAINALLIVMCSLPRHVSYWGSFADNDTIIWNHTTFPLMGIYWLSRYFERYHSDHSSLFDEYLTQVHGAFRGQVKSWKPQCDADSYQTIVPGHTIEYTLAENDYTYFENGNVRKFAELCTGMCDNRGAVAGFGDSGYATGPGYELRGLPMALWYYKDGRYLWRLQQIYDGKWKNPYHPEVQAVPWDEMAGLTVWPMAPEFYRWASEHPSYSEPVSPPNVPLEKAFDKISFRENLDRNGQYLLLDGFARGKHLHYDGNAITKYFADGEDWLIDGDYLVRNTTDHTMISVIKNGRCDALMPSAAGLQAHADLDGYAFTQTTVTDYNGADWTRNLLWMKGGPFLVIDALTAREAADFTFESVFKMLDKGDHEVVDGRSFAVVRPLEGGAGNRDLMPVRDPAPGVEKAMRFTTQHSRLEFPLELPAGEYVVTTFAQGTSTGSDSLFISVDGGTTTAFHTPIDKIGPSSSAPSKDAPTPNLTVPTSGKHVVSVTLREGPGILLDRIVFADEKGNEVVTIHAATASQIPEAERLAAPAGRFFIKTDGNAPISLSKRINHINLDLVYLRGRFGGQLAPGDVRSMQAIFYNDRTDAMQDWDIRRLDVNSCAVLRDGRPWGVFSADPASLGLPEALATDARACLIGPDALLVFGATSFGDVQTQKPVSAQINLQAGTAEIFCTEPTAMVLAFGEGMSAPAGTSRLDIAGWEGLSILRGAVRDILAKAASAPEPVTVQASRVEASPLAEAWREDFAKADEVDGAINKILPADLTGDGVEELLVAHGRWLSCLDAGGAEMWSLETDAQVNDMAVGDLNGDGKPEVLVGSDDEHFYIMDAAGKLLSRTKENAELRVGTSSVRDPRVSNVAIGDLDGSGKPDIIIGTRNGNILRYNTDLEKQWYFDRIEHGTYRMKLVDLDGDGKLEITAGNRYGAVEIVDAQGAALPGPYSELGDVVYDLGDLDGDGKYEIVNGSSTGACTCTRFLGTELFRFDNFGYGVTDVRIADYSGDGAVQTAISSETGYVYLLDGKGQVQTSRQLGDAVLSLAVIPGDTSALLAAGCRNGMVYVLDHELNPIGAALMPDPVTRLAATSADGGKKRLMVAAGSLLVGLGL